jgi:hypothetical protein
MGIWQRFVAWLVSGEKLDKSPSRSPLDIDVVKIAEELHILEEAKGLGEAGQPAPESTVLAGTELSIVAHINKARIEHMEWAASLRIWNADLSKLDITGIADRAAQADKEFDRLASATLTDRRRRLESLKEEALRCRRSLDEFKRQNKLSGIAHFPSGAGLVCQWALLLLFVFVEGGLNSALFAKGIDGGLISGFVYAAGFALVNVVVAALFGRFAVPNIFHRNSVRKAIGILGLLGALVVMLLISLVIAHFRDALVADVDAPGRVALQAFSHPFALNDLMSWWLFALSLLAGAAALVDGVLLDEVYPGFGPSSRPALVALYKQRLKQLGIFRKHTVDRIALKRELQAFWGDEQIARSDSLIVRNGQDTHQVHVALTLKTSFARSEEKQSTVVSSGTSWDSSGAAAKGGS